MNNHCSRITVGSNSNFNFNLSNYRIILSFVTITNFFRLKKTFRAVILDLKTLLLSLEHRANEREKTFFDYLTRYSRYTDKTIFPFPFTVHGI